MKKLPIGIKDFANIIEDNYLYIDKTEYIYKLINEGKYYFLSRPRRFGKSLMVSTLENIFSGNKELFRGLYIYDKWHFKKYPVIKIDFNEIKKDSKEIFEQNLLNRLTEIAEKYNYKLKYDNYKECFFELIKYLGREAKVVILIDEYDKPIIDTLTDLEVCKQNREILKTFYGTIKALDEYIQFCILTGVTKFSKTSIFSDLNNLYDISLDNNFNSMLGCTEIELEKYFEEYIEDCCKVKGYDKKKLLQKIKRWYNGYNFSGVDRLYNPFSILLFFKTYEFKNYWYETGKPTFLLNLLYEKQYDLSNLETLELFESSLGKFEIENLSAEAVLFQTGYLTIKKKIDTPRGILYKLHYPNLEVKNSLIDNLLKTYINKNNNETDKKILEMEAQLEAEDIHGFIENIKFIFSGIPNVLFVKKEAYYSSVIYTILALVGINAEFEQMNNLGRLDSAIKISDKVYIFEFKLNQPAEEGVKQIKEKKYADKYEKSLKKYLIGVELCDNLRNIKNYVFEKILE